MPLTDNYEWAKTNMPQSSFGAPFSNYQYNYINDINSSIYNNVSSSLVQIDLSSIYNSSMWTDTNSHYMVFPVVRCAEAFAAPVGANPPLQIPLTDNNYYLTALKNLNTSIIHQVDLVVGGKSASQLQAFTNIYTGIKMASELSLDDLKLIGSHIGMLEMNNPNSMTYNTAATADQSSPGVANNYVKGVPYTNVQNSITPPGTGIANGAIQQKLLLNKNVAGSYGGLENITNAQGMNNNLTPTFEIVSGKAVWKDYLIIFVKDIIDAFGKMGVVRRLDATLRIFVNTGFVRVLYPALDTMTFSLTDSTFTDTCPILINNNGERPVTDVVALNVGLFIARAPTYNFNGSNFTGVASPLTACRYYYNQLTIQPALALDYISSNSSKTIIYDQFLYNTAVNVIPSGNWSQLIQSGVSNIKTVILVPLVSSTLIGFNSYGSPFDPVGGCAGHPCSLQNFQVQVGGTNQLTTSLMYNYENYIQEMRKFNKQSSSEYGVESGLWSPEFWTNNKVYLANIRGTEDDQNTPRNIVVSFRNNSNVPIDVLIFVQYEDKLVVNVSTGIITK